MTELINAKRQQMASIASRITATNNEATAAVETMLRAVAELKQHAEGDAVNAFTAEQAVLAADCAQLIAIMEQLAGEVTRAAYTYDQADRDCKKLLTL